MLVSITIPSSFLQVGSLCRLDSHRTWDLDRITGEMTRCIVDSTVRAILCLMRSCCVWQSDSSRSTASCAQRKPDSFDGATWKLLLSHCQHETTEFMGLSTSQGRRREELHTTQHNRTCYRNLAAGEYDDVLKPGSQARDDNLGVHCCSALRSLGVWHQRYTLHGFRVGVQRSVDLRANSQTENRSRNVLTP